ncbi:hypothetical protein CMI37_33070 [Candidatus Pacearchaeota archaeon]|nr:hypothetical protein [Candidatus Pacearchaeota archaeon]|tara:strand:- start:6683 stop:7123 length:441 start_codon:yes stop_codon:yes gene_type:complete
MIFIHLLVGIILGISFGNLFFFILGSLFPDIDHIYIIIKNKLWNIRKIKESIKFEKKFGIRYKTKLFHSVLGLILFSFLIFILYPKGAIYFGLAYFLHLLIDWIDIDEKYFLYPLKIKFKGSLPIWSRLEKIITIVLIIIIILLKT